MEHFVENDYNFTSNGIVMKHFCEEYFNFSIEIKHLVVCLFGEKKMQR